MKILFNIIKCQEQLFKDNKKIYNTSFKNFFTQKHNHVEISFGNFRLFIMILKFWFFRLSKMIY